MSISCSVLPREMRETQAQFLSPTGSVVFSNSSAYTRPDAVTQDYLTAFSYGPIEIGIADSGSVYKPWRVRATSSGSLNTFYLAAPGTASWVSESVLFTYTGSTPFEIDVAFSSDARPVVCVERSNSVWLRWFNPLANGYSFDQMSVTGSRSPRVVLDAPEDLSSSDILLFYFRPTSGSDSYLYWREQRDRYATEYSVKLPTLDVGGVLMDRYLEDVVKLRDSRVAIYYSDRNPVTARWSIGRFETILYPQFADPDKLYLPIYVPSASLRPTLNYSWYDSFTVDTVNMLSGSLTDIRIYGEISGAFANFVSCSIDLVPLSASLDDVRFAVTMFYGFAPFISASIKLRSGSLEQHIGNRLYDVDSIASCSVSFVSASLV